MVQAFDASGNDRPILTNIQQTSEVLDAKIGIVFLNENDIAGRSFQAGLTSRFHAAWAGVTHDANSRVQRAELVGRRRRAVGAAVVDNHDLGTFDSHPGQHLDHGQATLHDSISSVSRRQNDRDLFGGRHARGLERAAGHGVTKAAPRLIRFRTAECHGST